MKRSEISAKINFIQWVFGTSSIWISAIYIYVLFYLGIISSDDAFWDTFREPFVIFFHIAFISFLNYVLYTKLSKLRRGLSEPGSIPTGEMQQIIRFIPRFMGLVFLLFPTTGSLVHAMFLKFNAETILGALYSFVFGLLIPMPVYFMGIRYLEEISIDLPLSKKSTTLPLGFKIIANVIITLFSVVALFILANLSFVELYKEKLTIGLMAEKNFILMLFTLAIGFLNTMSLRRNIVKPLENLSKTSYEVSSGNFNKLSQITERDEIGLLNKSFTEMVESINKATKSVQTQIERINQGDLNSRINTDEFPGEWKKLAEATNSLTQAFVTPISITNNYLERISKGDIPQKLTEGFNGDFVSIKNAINQLIDSTQKIVEITRMIGNGYLDVKIDLRSKDDEQMQALNNMVTAIAEVIEDVIESVRIVAGTAEDLSHAAQTLSSGSAEQAAASEQASSSVEEMTASINSNAENARQAETLAKQVSDSVIIITEAVKATNEAMHNIVNKISVINDIAERTDLLAINAAIEAARAGDFGKGFAVVASEVRQLAENTMRAAQDIQEVSTNSMNKALSSQKLLENLIPNITKNSVLVQEITSASIEQASGTAQINQAILQLTQVTQSNSVASEELASTAEQLSSHAEMLVKTISFFNKNLISASDLNLEMEARIKKLTSELDAMKTENKKLKTMVKSQPKANGILLDLSTSPETSIDNEFESFT